MGPGRAAIAIGFVCVALPAFAQSPRALQITPENASELLIGGPDAIGGVGDWYLANDRVEAIVDDPSRRHAKLNHGGTLVDVGRIDRRDEDQFARLIPLLNMSQRVIVGYDAIRAETDGDGRSARLVVSSSRPDSIPRGSPLARTLDPLVPAREVLAGVRIETAYEVRSGEPFVRITTRIENRGSEPAPIFAFGDLWMRGGRSMRSFVADATSPERSPGFEHRSFSRNLLSSLGAIERFSHVAMAGLPAFPPVAYALFSPERTAAGLSFFGVTGEHVTLAMALRGDDGGTGASAWRLLVATRETLPPGEIWEIERRLLVTPRADVGSATDEVLLQLGVTDRTSGIAGRALPEGVRTVVHVETREGHPVTQLLAEGGRYRARLPPGDYRLVLRAPHRAPILRSVRVVEGEAREVETVHWPPLAALRIERAFADGGAGRVVVRGRDGTPDPVFDAELLGFRVDGRTPPSGTEADSINFVGNGGDPSRIPLAPGRYTVTATRGLEFASETRHVAFAAGGEELSLAPFALARVAAVDGYVSADLHVHAQASDDSGTPNRARVRDFVAAGVEVIVATDHDHVPDYATALAEEGLAERIHVVRGVEVTSSTPSEAAPWTIGHHNAWPVAFEPLVHRRGAPPSQEMGVGELYSLLRGRYDARVVQLNHPRGKRPGTHDGNFFTHLGTLGTAVDVALPLTTPPNAALLEAAADGTRPIDFDVIEVMNGEAWHQYLVTREDFHWLLRQGVRRTATANSDTHGPDELAGMPRNYVRVPAGLESDPVVLDEALRLGRSFGTTGPLVLHFSVNGASMGDTVRAPGGRTRVEYEVVAAPWVPLDEVRLLVNGEVVRVHEGGSGAADLILTRDAFVTLEAGVPLDADPAIWRATHRGPYTDMIAPGFLPVAFTNPVFVDVDGDGAWQSPGLGPIAPPAPLGSGSLVTALALVAIYGTWRRRRWNRRVGGFSRSAEG